MRKAEEERLVSKNVPYYEHKTAEARQSQRRRGGGGADPLFLDTPLEPELPTPSRSTPHNPMSHRSSSPTRTRTEKLQLVSPAPEAPAPRKKPASSRRSGLTPRGGGHQRTQSNKFVLKSSHSGSSRPSGTHERQSEKQHVAMHREHYQHRQSEKQPVSQPRPLNTVGESRETQLGGGTLAQWIESAGLAGIVTAQQLSADSLGFTDAHEIAALPLSDLEQVCEKLGLRFGRKGRFLKAIQRLKDSIESASPKLESPPSKTLERLNFGAIDERTQRVQINVMIAGEAGLGKTTFLQAAIVYEKIVALTLGNASSAEFHKLFSESSKNAHDYMSQYYQGDVPDDGRTDRIIELKPLSIASGNRTVDLSVKFIDTPGYADGVGGLSYIKEIDLLRREVTRRMDTHYEARVQHLHRSDVPDTRIHMIFLFLRSRIKECDRYFVETLSQFAPIIPIAAQADQLDLDERRAFRKIIKKELQPRMKDGLFFHFKTLEYHSEPEVYFVGANWKLKSGVRFTRRHPDGDTVDNVADNLFSPDVVLAKDDPEEAYNAAFSRMYPWGHFRVLDQEHSDFTTLLNVMRAKALNFDHAILEPKFRAYVSEVQNMSFDSTHESYVRAREIVQRFEKWLHNLDDTTPSGQSSAMDVVLEYDGQVSPRGSNSNRNRQVLVTRTESPAHGIRGYVEKLHAQMAVFRDLQTSWTRTRKQRDEWDQGESKSIDVLRGKLVKCKRELGNLADEAEMFEERARVGDEPKLLVKEWGIANLCERYQRTLKRCIDLENRIVEMRDEQADAQTESDEMKRIRQKNIQMQRLIGDIKMQTTLPGGFRFGETVYHVMNADPRMRYLQACAMGVTGKGMIEIKLGSGRVSYVSPSELSRSPPREDTMYGQKIVTGRKR